MSYASSKQVKSTNDLGPGALDFIGDLRVSESYSCEIGAPLSKNPDHQITITSWWFQPLWKILVKMGIFPK